MFLTDREFWLNYWESHRDEVNVVVPGSNLFSPVFQRIFSGKHISSTCELGGFPGTFSIYLKRKYNTDATLVDYVVPRQLLNEVMATNGLKENDIHVIEADLFDHTPSTSYDMVFSVGLIEHFDDTKKIIDLHLPWLNPGGSLVIFLPNFRGLNGWFQRRFDKANYDKHNISSMDPDMLKAACISLGLKDVDAGWYSRFGVWLEREHLQPLWVRMLKKTVWFCGKVIFKFLPFESRMFSPYIVVTATK